MTRPHPDDIDPADVPPVGAPLPYNRDNIDPADVPDVRPLTTLTPAARHARRAPSWLDIPGVAGLLGGAGFLIGSVGLYCIGRLMFWGYIEW